MYRVRSKDGRPWKRFYRNANGEIDSHFTPGQYFDLVQPITSDNSMQRLASQIKRSRCDNQLIIPNLPKDGRTTDFNLVARGLRLDPFDKGILDADLAGANLLSLPNLHERSQDKLIRAGLPSNMAYVAVWSSSRFLITAEPKECLHIIFPFKEALNQDEYRDFLELVEGDVRMAERGRILATMPPTFEKNVPFTDYERYQEIYYQEGELLDAKKYMEGRSKPAAISSREVYRHIHHQLDNEHFYDALKDYFDDKKQKVSWSDIRTLTETSSYLVKTGRMKHRHNIHYQLLRLAHRSKVDIQDVITWILEDEILLGKHSESELLSQASKVKRDFLEKSRGGSIEKIFTPGEIIEVYHDSLQDLTNETWRELFIRDGVVVISSPCGSGKDYFGIKGFIDRLDPESLISVAHRIAVGRTTEKTLGLTYQDDMGLDSIDKDKDKRNRKLIYMPGHETPSILIQSIHYLDKSGAIQKRQAVVVNEIEHVLEEIYLAPESQNSQDLYDRHSKWFRNFLTLCDEADICIFASDMASAGLTGWFLEQLNSWKKEQRRLLLNHTDYIATMRFSQLASEAEAISTVIELIRDNKTVAIVSDAGTRDSKRSVERLAAPIKEILNTSSHQIKTFDRYSFDDEVRPNLRDDPWDVIPKLFDDGMQAMVVSPIFDVGWQNARSEENYVFDAVVMIDWYGMAHGQRLIQWFRRYRFTTQVFAYIKHSRGIYQKTKKAEEPASIPVKYDLWTEFLKIGGAVMADRMDAPRQHFWDEIEDRGGNFVASPYPLEPQLLDNVQSILNNEMVRVEDANAENLKKSADLLSQVCEIIFEEMELDPTYKEIKLRQVKSLQSLTKEEILALNKSVISDDDAVNLARAWRGNEYEKAALQHQLPLMDVSLIAQLLQEVDLSLQGSFPSNIRSLLELTLDKRYKTEIVWNGIDNTDAWVDFIEGHKDQILSTGYKHLVMRGIGPSLRNFIKMFAELFCFDFEEREKKTGIAQAQKDLEASYAKRGITVRGSKVMEKRTWLKHQMLIKVNKDEPLTHIENQFYETIGDRVILRRRDIVPMRLYSILTDILDVGTADIVDIEDLALHKPETLGINDSEKNNFYKASF